MIESISISDIATYAIAPEVLDGLAQFNFLFGSNGTGKTTVSRVIADENSFPTCKVTWKAGTKLQPMVYNRDFVERKHLVKWRMFATSGRKCCWIKSDSVPVNSTFC